MNPINTYMFFYRIKELTKLLLLLSAEITKLPILKNHLIPSFEYNTI